MKTKYLLLSLFVAITIITMNTAKVSSNILFPPAGSTGDAGPFNTCGRAGCHNTTVQTPAAGNVTFTIGTGSPTTPLNTSFQYMPGDTYNLAFLLNQTATRYGFQVSVANAALAQAGSFTQTNLTNTS